MAVHIVDHPLVKHKLGILRRHELPVREFRAVSNEICRLLTYEATKSLETESVTVKGWAGPVTVERIKGKKMTVVPILRAGIGMLDGFLDMIPGAKVSVVQKQDQRTGKLTEGIVAKLLTKSPNHPHGIKVMLEDGIVGRVKEVL